MGNFQDGIIELADDMLQDNLYYAEMDVDPDDNPALMEVVNQDRATCMRLISGLMQTNAVPESAFAFLKLVMRSSFGEFTAQPITDTIEQLANSGPGEFGAYASARHIIERIFRETAFMSHENREELAECVSEHQHVFVVAQDVLVELRLILIEDSPVHQVLKPLFDLLDTEYGNGGEQ